MRGKHSLRPVPFPPRRGRSAAEASTPHPAADCATGTARGTRCSRARTCTKVQVSPGWMGNGESGPSADAASQAGAYLLAKSGSERRTRKKGDPGW